MLTRQIKKSQVTGGQLVEAVNINLGLLALKSCITALRRRKSRCHNGFIQMAWLLSELCQQFFLIR